MASSEQDAAFVADQLREGMIEIPGGTFRMGSDRHYPEEAPVHRVTVDPFLIDRTPVTNRQFKEFVRATGYVTSPKSRPTRHDYPGALPHMLIAGSLVFTPPKHAVDLRDWSQWWDFTGLRTGVIPMGARAASTRSTIIRSCMSLTKMPPPMRNGPARSCRREAEWEFAARGGLDGAEYAWGDELTPGGRHMANTWQGNFPHQNLNEDGLRAHLAGDGVSAQRLRRLRHDRQCLGMDQPTGIRRSTKPMRRRPAASRKIRAAAVRPRATTPVSPTSRFRARCSRAARICARRTTAAAIGRPRDMRSRSIRRRSHVGFRCVVRRGEHNE